MKKLQLLKPDKQTVYLNKGKGQEINYLQLNSSLDKDALESDVKNGAVLYKEVLDLVQKEPSRFVVIKAGNEEEGLTAATYLLSSYKKMEGNSMSEVEDFGELPFESSKEKVDISFSDDEDLICFDSYDEDWEDFEDFQSQDNTDWEENSSMVPILSYNDILVHEENSLNSYSNGPFVMGGMANPSTEAPYWLSLREESVCIIRHVNELGGGYFYGAPHRKTMADYLRRFSNNRHVILIMIHDKPASFMGTEELSGRSYQAMEAEKEVCEVMLEYLAATISVSAEKEEKMAYYENLFENWIDCYERKLTNGFPKAQTVERITSIQNPDKSLTMERVVKYASAQNPDKELLEEKDFELLAKFKLLGVEEKAEKKNSTARLKDELVGMDSVKDQIANVVNVMKYNKKRREMGLGDSGFHNVHMLIGAPGTAKTTVAQLLGNIMCEEKLLPGNRFICVNGADLKGAYVGHSAPKTKALFDEHDVILIDEAYSIAASSQGEGGLDSFSQEAIAQLIIELEKHGMDKLVMFAGYGGINVSDKDNKMKTFLDANPGIKSRINSTIYFDSYTPDQMVAIFHAMAKQRKCIVDAECDELLKAYFSERVSDRNFGNGREARSVLENVMIYTAERTMKLPVRKQSKKVLSTITKEDVYQAIGKLKEGYFMQKGQGAKRCGFTTN